MSRSLKKGPFIDYKLEKRVLEMNDPVRKLCKNLVKKIRYFT